MRMINFAKRNFKELVRDPLSLIFEILLPLFLLFIFQQVDIPDEIYKLELRQSTDNKNKDNEDNAIFLTSSIYTAAAYAFSRRLKELNEHYSFSMNNNGELPAMVFEVKNLPDDLCAYIYIFENRDLINVGETLGYDRLDTYKYIAKKVHETVLLLLQRFVNTLCYPHLLFSTKAFFRFFSFHK